MHPKIFNKTAVNQSACRWIMINIDFSTAFSSNKQYHYVAINCNLIGLDLCIEIQIMLIILSCTWEHSTNSTESFRILAHVLALIFFIISIGWNLNSNTRMVRMAITGVSGSESVWHNVHVFTEFLFIFFFFF